MKDLLKAIQRIAQSYFKITTCSSELDPYPLRGILAEQVGMDGEVKRPQCGRYLASAQGPYCVPPTKAVRKSRQFPDGLSAIYREITSEASRSTQIAKC